MANLKKTLIKGSQKLGMTSEEDLQALSARKGRSLPPSSPVEAGQLGAQPHQAKMVGSKASQESNLKKALSETAVSEVAPTYSLQQALAHRKARTERTSAEDMQRDLSERMSTSGSHLVSQAGVAAKQAFADAAESGTADLKLQFADQGIEMTEDEAAAMDRVLNQQGDLASLTADLNLLSKNKDLPVDLSVFQQDPASAAESIKNSLGDFGAQVGAATAEAVADDITVMDLYDDEEWASVSAELAADYGLSEEEISSMTVQELQQKIDEKIQSDFETTERLQNMAQDPSLSPAERAEAIKQLQDMGALDVAALELDDMTTLAAEVETADDIEIGGKSYTIADLLDNSQISATVSNYVDMEAGPEKDAAEALLKELGIKDWVDDNEEVLQTAVEKLDTGVKKIADIQKANYENQKNAASLLGLSEEEAKSLYGTGFVTDVKELGINQLFAAAEGGDIAAQGALNELKGLGMEAAEYSPEQLKYLVHNKENAEDLRDYKKAKQDLQTFEYAESPNDFMDNFEGILMDAIKGAKFTESLGQRGPSHILEALSPNMDGKLADNWKDTLKGMMQGSLADILTGNPDIWNKDKLKKHLMGFAQNEAGLKPSDLDASGKLDINKVAGGELGPVTQWYEQAEGAFTPEAKASAISKTITSNPPGSYYLDANSITDMQNQHANVLDSGDLGQMHETVLKLQNQIAAMDAKGQDSGHTKLDRHAAQHVSGELKRHLAKFNEAYSQKQAIADAEAQGDIERINELKRRNAEMRGKRYWYAN